MKCCQKVCILLFGHTISSCRARYNYVEETVNSALQPGELALLSSVYFPLKETKRIAVGI